MWGLFQDLWGFSEPQEPNSLLLLLCVFCGLITAHARLFNANYINIKLSCDYCCVGRWKMCICGPEAGCSSNNIVICFGSGEHVIIKG